MAIGIYSYTIFCFIIILTIIFSVTPTSQQQKYFYIYDYGVWKDISKLSLHPRSRRELFHFNINHGAGAIRNLTQGLYHTDQYQLYLLIFYRALIDHRRTWDPAQATTFIIPYDFTSDVGYHATCPLTPTTCYNIRKCPSTARVTQALEESPWFRRYQGRDHLLIVGTQVDR